MSYPKTLVDFDVLTYNVRGLGDERKDENLLTILKEHVRKIYYFSPRDSQYPKS